MFLTDPQTAASCDLRMRSIKNTKNYWVFDGKSEKIECHVIRICHMSTMPGESVRSMNPSSRKKSTKSEYLI